MIFELNTINLFAVHSAAHKCTQCCTQMYTVLHTNVHSAAHKCTQCCTQMYTVLHTNVHSAAHKYVTIVHVYRKHPCNILASFPGFPLAFISPRFFYHRRDKSKGNEVYYIRVHTNACTCTLTRSNMYTVNVHTNTRFTHTHASHTCTHTHKQLWISLIKSTCCMELSLNSVQLNLVRS